MARRFLKVLAWTVAILALAFIGLRLGLAAWGGSQLKKAEAAWAGDPDYAKLAAAKPQETNDSARKLETLVAAVGLDLRPKTGEKPGMEKPAIEYPGKAADAWIKAVVAAGGKPVEPLPSEVSAFLAAHSADLDAIVEHLAGAELPRWSVDVSRGFDAPLPNLLAHTKLNRLLLIRALDESAAGRADRAAAALEAAWKLDQSLAARPELICQLVRIAGLRYTCAVLRRMPAAPEVWLPRLEGIDTRADLRRSFDNEAWASLQAARSEQIPTGDMEVGTAWVVLLGGKGFFRLELAGEAQALRQIVKNLDGLDPCTGNPTGVAGAVVEALPSWNVMAKIMIPNLDSAWSRALQCDLEVALTRTVLASRQARAAGTAPPAPLPLRCASWAFRETATPDGGFSVALDGKVPWTLEESTLDVPLSHVEPPMVAPSAPAAAP